MTSTNRRIGAADGAQRGGSASTGFGEQQKPRLLDRVRTVLRAKHYSMRTEQTYVQWIRRFILFHDRRHPEEMSAKEITAFLEYLAQERKVSSSTQNQALSAILFLYRDVLGLEFPNLGEVVRAKPSKRLPVVFTRTEVREILKHLKNPQRLMASLGYGLWSAFDYA